MPITMLCLPLVWLLATATATVTLVSPALGQELPLPDPPGVPVPTSPRSPCTGARAGDLSQRTEAAHRVPAATVATFALRFYQRMAEAARPEANLLFSPITVAMGLSHLLLGARGETRERLAAVLAYPPGLSCVHSALRLLSTAPGLFSATQIFHHPDLHLRTRFLNESWRFYNTRPWALSGNESLDLQRINAWVREASRGLLPELLSTLPPEPQLVLLSAVHLQGTAPGWGWTRDRAGPHPSCAGVKAQEGRGAVGRLSLRGGLSLVLLLPLGPPGALGALERALDPPSLLRLLRRAARAPPRATALALPRVRLDVPLDVVPLVHDMGEHFGLFLDAELCGLARGAAVAVDAARHRAVLALDETGVEAAGAMATSVARSAPLLEALRPFLFVLWHDSADVPVFMGRLSDPPP
uniref:Uncharacterized protein n=1 Tax=Melopsittacus undulatus TaxID=13146 RepID=A0A8V5FTK2_MELUD